MNYGIYSATSGALVEETCQDVIANNLANIGTTGFKRDTAIFRTRLNEALEDLPPSRFDQHRMLEKLGGGVFLDEVVYSSANGALEATANAFDVALQGDGLFAVERNGEQMYTRDGRFQRTPTGELTTLDGTARVLDSDRKPLEIPPGEFQVSEDGEIFVDDESTGRLGIFGALDPTKFQKVGANLFRFNDTGTPAAAAPKVRQGFLERSSVSPVNEMVKLIQSHRAYEANMRMLRIQDGTVGRLVNEFGRLA